MPNKTTNYQLNQWEASDDFLRTDFNEDNAKIEAALDTKAEIVAGTYTGDGKASQTISLGFTPKALLTTNKYGQMCDSTGSNWYYGGLVLPDHPIMYSTKPVLEVTEDGFKVYNYSDVEYIKTNSSGAVYHYIAFK